MRRETSGANADGEVVWSWRPDAGAKFSRTQFAKVTGAKEPGPRGEHEVTVKTIAQGRPDDPAPPVVTTVCFLPMHGPPVRAGTRSSLRPLFFKGQLFLHNSGKSCREIAKSYLEVVIARSARDEAIHRSSFAARWIASRALVMAALDGPAV
jgi:hypothetical protein